MPKLVLPIVANSNPNAESRAKFFLFNPWRSDVIIFHLFSLIAIDGIGVGDLVKFWCGIGNKGKETSKYFLGFSLVLRNS